jgi:hypothetical protein
MQMLRSAEASVFAALLTVEMRGEALAALSRLVLCSAGAEACGVMASMYRRVRNCVAFILR